MRACAFRARVRARARLERACSRVHAFLDSRAWVGARARVLGRVRACAGVCAGVCRRSCRRRWVLALCGVPVVCRRCGVRWVLARAGWGGWVLSYLFSRGGGVGWCGGVLGFLCAGWRGVVCCWGDPSFSLGGVAASLFSFFVSFFVSLCVRTFLSLSPLFPPLSASLIF